MGCEASFRVSLKKKKCGGGARAGPDPYLQLEVLQPCLVVAKNLSQLLRIIPLLVAVRVAILGATGHEVIALRLDGTEIGETVILVLVDDVNLFSLIFRV